MLAARPASIVRQKDMSAAWRHVDFVMVAVVAMTSMFGVAMVYSATRTGTDPWAFAEKHIVFAVIGSVAAAAAGVIDYSKYAQWSRLLYLGGILCVDCTLSGDAAQGGVEPVEINPVIDPRLPHQGNAVQLGRGVTLQAGEIVGRDAQPLGLHPDRLRQATLEHHADGRADEAVVHQGKFGGEAHEQAPQPNVTERIVGAQLAG